MRARSVNENISFKRGMDPKGIMDIGRNADNDITKYETINFKKEVEKAKELDYAGWQMDLEALNLISKTLKVPEKSILCLDPYSTSNPDSQYLFQEAKIVDSISGKDIVLQISDRGLIFMMEKRDFLALWVLGIDYRLAESINFERGMDPKGSMKIGKASKVNYFRDNLTGIPYKEYIEEEGAWPWDQGREILKEAAKMLEVNEEDVLIAVEYGVEPLTTTRIEEYIDDHEWNYDEDRDVGDFTLIKTTTGEIYVFELNTQEDPYMILGSRF